jgi:cell division protein FtsQ
MKKNRYKNKTEKVVKPNIFLKPVLIILLLCLANFILIYVYDFTMQSRYFTIKKIKIIGNNRVVSKEIMGLAKIKKTDNLLSINLNLLEKRIANHPWVKDALVKRNLPSTLLININEEIPLALVKIDNIAEIIINHNGTPFKEYNPEIDKVDNLPVITGLVLTKYDNDYLFKGQLLNSVLKVLTINEFGKIYSIKADKNMGISILTFDQENQVLMKLGFNNFKNKALKAKQIKNYFKNHMANKEICTFDLYDPENVFVKSKDKDALHNLTKGGA